MKKSKYLPVVLLFSVLLISIGTLKAQAPFITVWKTDNPGTSGTDQITIPTEGAGYNYDINWVSVTDATVFGSLMGQTGDATVTFPAVGTYEVAITGDFPRIYFNDTGDKEKILTVEQWGDMAWASMEGAFRGAASLQVTATDAPDLSAVTTMFRMFEGASSLNSDMDHWDVSNVINMGVLFRGASLFNGNISSWDVSNVFNMGSMFMSATAFDGDLGSWDVTGVTNMSIMFAGASAFTGTGLSGWDVSAVTDMGSLFANTAVFNADISGWNVSGVTNMGSMFIEATGFNGDLSGWDVSSVNNMSYLFLQASAFNGDIGGWDVSSVTTMASMFDRATSFDRDLSGWDISAVTDMTSMFNQSGLSRANYDATLTGWVGQAVQPSVTLGALNLEYCAATERQSLIDNHGWTFTGDAPSAVCPLPDAFVTTWKTDNPGTSGPDQITIPTTGGGYNYDIRWASLADPTVFGSLTGQTGDVTLALPAAGTYEVSITGDFPRIYFNDAGDKEKILTVEQWGNIAWTSMENSFYGAINLEVNASDAPDLTSVTSTAYMFALAASLNSDFSHWDVSNITTMELMFGNAWVFDGDLSGWDVSGVTDMGQLFLGARVFTGKGLAGWDVSGAEITWGMFTGASVFNADIGGWDVSNVIHMSSMFQDATSFNADISGWDVSNVEKMGSMFVNAAAFNSDISGWDVGSVDITEGMFQGASSFSADISGWDVSKVVYMRRMFLDAPAFDQNLGGWDITAAIAMESMFDGSGLSQANYDATLTGWATQAVQSGVPLGAMGRLYCSSTRNRYALINDHGWTITGDRYSGTCTLPGAFVTTWNPGVVGPFLITVPTTGTGYDYDIHWASLDDPLAFGALVNQTGDVTLTVPASGTYRISIVGDFPRIYINDGTEKSNIRTVEQWGDIAWTSMENSFYGAANLQINATDAPDLSNVTSTVFMFASASSLNSDLNHWDVANVTDMRGMFTGASAFNGDVSSWNVSNVNYMTGLFDHATSFNGDIRGWNVSNVLGMRRMFAEAASFNADISGWQVGRVSNMESMFLGATSFDVDLSGWDITAVTDMTTMLDNAGLSRANYDATLTGWAAQAVQTGVALGAMGLEYCAAAERQSMIDDHGWVFSGDAAAASCARVITGVTFADGSFTYDGTTQSLAISGTLPAGTSVSYTDNNRTDVGSQTVTATIAGGASYDDLVLTATLTVTPATITGITFPDGSFVYDGTARSLAIDGTLPPGTSVSYADNSRMDAGSQTATATISGGTNYDDLVLTATLTITPATITGITFADGSFTYDGTARSLAIDGTLPPGTSVSYADNTRTDAGSQTATATVSGGTNYDDLVLTAMLTVTPATITGITFADGAYVYDGTAQSLAIDGTLPSGTSVSYADNSRMDAGSQTATATVSGGTNYDDLVLTATLTITPATITGITFPDGSFTYDGTAQSLAIDGTLPPGTSVSYADNSRMDAGSQTATATVSGGTNYDDLVLTATLTITPATITGITFPDGSFTYDGTARSLAIDGTLPPGTSVSYADNSRTEVGSQIVTATINGGINYNDRELTATLAVLPSVRTLTFAAPPPLTYGDADYTLNAESSSGEDILYSSSNEGVAVVVDGAIRIVGAGTAILTATVPENPLYENTPAESHTLTVRKAQQQITFADVGTVDRNAGIIALDVAASSGLDVALAIDNGLVAEPASGSQLNILRIGTVNVTATQGGDDNYLPAEPVIITVRVVDMDSDFPVRVHPVVSPNGDGINDFLIIEGIRDYPANRFYIVNQNGTEVANIIGYNHRDRAFRGVGAGGIQLPAGTYFYVLEVRHSNQWTYRKGYFILRY